MKGNLSSRIFRWFLFVFAVSLIIISDLRRPPEPPTPVPTGAELKAAYPDAARLEERYDPFHHWIAWVGANKAAGAVFITTELPPDVRGYVGPVPVLVGVDSAGTIKRLVVLKNRETPYYMRRVLQSKFISRFSGKNITDNLDDIDAVSGATITSKAIAGDVSGAARLAAQKLFSIKVPAATRNTSTIFHAILLSIALLIALAARIRHRNRSLKWASWTTSIAITGIYLSIPLSFCHISTLLEGRLPPLSNLTLWVLLVWSLFTTPIWGPVFCGYACPFGAMQEIAWAAAPWSKWSVSEQVGKNIRAFRYLILLALIVLVFPFGIAEAAGFEPYPYLFDQIHRLIFRSGGAAPSDLRLSLIIWMYALFVLLISTKFKRFWCRMFCPTGACLSMLNIKRSMPIQSGSEIVDESQADG